MSKITLGNIIEETEMPMIEVLINDECVGYLTPFRGYKFQVSGTKNGEGDLGSSEVVGLANLLSMMTVPTPIAETTKSTIWASNLSFTSGSVVKYFYELLALEALRKCSTYPNLCKKYGNIEAFTHYGLGDDRYAKLKNFIDLCYDYIKSCIPINNG